ncbi:MAG TPA: thioredoxin domain-containing protein [Thermoanaerobaculia bacterium]|nr:thioredoxin domain-containing protein [Thermoanaerobaculia bacterium]
MKAMSSQTKLLYTVLAALVLAVPALAQTEAATAAVVDGKRITIADVDRTIEARLRPLQEQIYALRKGALENLIVTAVLEREAAQRKITVAQLRKELSAGTFEIPSADIERTLQEHLESFAGMSPDEVRERVRIDLESQERMRQYRERVARLQEQSGVQVLLGEPTVSVSVAGLERMAKGNPDARITLVEFADFQCPYCRGASKTVEEVLARYKDDVRVVFRHLPLNNHAQAFDAARAAYCASEQSRFWEYHDALFEADSLSGERLSGIATEVGLEPKAFASCIGAERSRTAVMTDLQEARRLGISGTPAFIVNGVLLTGAVPLEELQRLLDRQLAAIPSRLASIR